MKNKKSKVYRCADCNYIFSEVSERDSDIQSTCPRCNVYGVKRCLEQRALEVAAEKRRHQPLLKTRVYTFSGYDGLMRSRFETEENLAMFQRHVHRVFDNNPVVSGEVWLTLCPTQPSTWDVAPESPTNAGKQLKNFVVYCEQHNLQTACYGHYLEMTEDMQRLLRPTREPEQTALSGSHPAPVTTAHCQHADMEKNSDTIIKKHCHE
ncbi:hypothetical protein [Alteromonas sp. H39]|uniref:hypothetical protein n=1 Tax=Alteromonas sp. H39 TaxID=3389876 RepID=UPI0039E0784C